MENKKLLKNIGQWFREIKELENLDSGIKIKHSFDTKDKTIIFKFSIIDKKVFWTRGSSNRTIDNKRIFYIDYDNLNEKYVEEELILLQEQYNIGDIYLFKSSNKGIHAVSFSKFSLKEFIEILNNSSCDYAFKNMPYYLKFSKYWILRQFAKGNTPKPLYIKTLKGNTDRQNSYAHWKYFKILYPDAEINQLTNSDGLEDITIVDYPTGSNV